MDPGVLTRCIGGGRGEGVNAIGGVGIRVARGGEGVGNVGGMEGLVYWSCWILIGVGRGEGRSGH